MKHIGTIGSRAKIRLQGAGFVFCTKVLVQFDKILLCCAFCRDPRGFQESKGAKMTRNKHARHHGGAEREQANLNWRRLHHTRLFWVALFMMLLAITIYVLSDDLAWRPRIQR
ncbi:MAG TPA: hypothetical protein VIF02_14100 [Methylocella sp.]